MRNSVTLTALLLCLHQLSVAQKIDAKVILKNIPNQKGTLYIGWYNKASSYRDPGKAVFKQQVELTEQTTFVADFKDIPAGDYAISVFFDTNKNGVLDFNLLGIPKEHYGFSNNVFHITRATAYDEAKFNLRSDNQVIHIKLK